MSGHAGEDYIEKLTQGRKHAGNSLNKPSPPYRPLPSRSAATRSAKAVSSSPHIQTRISGLSSCVCRWKWSGMSSYQFSHGQDHVAFADDYNTHCILQLLSSDNNRKCLTKLNFSECEQSMHMHHDVYMLVPLLSLLRLLPLPDVALMSPTVPNEFVPDTLRCGTYGFVTRSADWSYSTALFCLFRRDLCTYRSL